MQALRISLYIFALVFSNFIVLWFGLNGMLLTALFLIPFDFAMRCMFHEQWKGVALVIKIGSLIVCSSIITYAINSQTQNIAIASSASFLSAQISASLFYQRFIKQPYFIKVNGSDLIAIIVDSICFQLIAFSAFNYKIAAFQIILKTIGGLFWYWVLFAKTKIYKTWR
jgi:hypothetical protein